MLCIPAFGKTARPNILLILADDLGYADLGVQGCTQFQTPNIDSIAKNGVRCKQGYVSNSVCAPSRAGILSGLTSAGAQLLAGPCELLADGGPVTWTAVTRVEAADDHVIMGRTGRAPGLSLELTTRIEFDGMCRFDLKVTPVADAQRPTELTLQIPLAAGRATLMHHPGRWFDDQTCAGAVPDDGWQAPNTLWLWVGDEDRGLCWFAEDQAAWSLDPDRPGISLTPEGGRTVMRVSLANVAGRLNAPRSFTWGLMATPVKPMPDDWRTWRFGSPIYPSTNVAVQWSVKSLSRWHSFPVPIEPEKYRELARTAHAAGKRIVPYTNFNMQSDTGPEWTYWGEDWNACAGEGKAADVLLDKGVKTVIITLGEKGFLLADKAGKEMIASYKVKAVDSTAAGDAFTGALAFGLASGKSIKEAAIYANAVAAISVTRLGAQPSMPTKEEVDAFIK